MISIIVAVSDDMGIGKNNELLWHIPDDLRRFKKLTYGKTVIMGKKTWESLPKRPLPGRKNIVLTDIPHECIDGAVTVYSIEDAVSKCEKDEDVFIMGGGSVYRQFMPIADRLYITHVHKKTPADVYFPEIDPGIWEVVEKDEFNADESNEVSYAYVIYERKNRKK
ncbi:MAG: dihydrofolate reductase [Bacteroidales bacterium]|nr:dihydrofolate reductase [Bacteroidales bacterium]